MATVLAAQLAQIAAKSSNPLDLKAQKKAHSQSLFFEQHVAATQDFDTLYQICLEGYLELCHIDKRFLGFASNIFSEQSKEEERSQMTAGQNKELDEVLESFLGLVGQRLALSPAVKAVEWLVRRFRIHEHNTQFLVLTFLPYHTIPTFARLLSILPKNLPPLLKFLHPYTESYACPPRHSIVYTMTHNHSFFNIFNNYILKISHAAQQYPALISYWAATTTEALVGMVDHSISGRREVQIQKAEDVLLRILPVLNEGLSIRHVPDMRVGCYMILTVLASKINLEDSVLTAMMEAVAMNWTPDTTHAGLICLAVLAQQRRISKIPKKVFKAVISIQGFERDLRILNEQYEVDNLTLSIVLAILERVHKDQDAYQLSFVRTSIEEHLMSTQNVSTAIKSILEAANRAGPEQESGLDVQGQLADLILRLMDSKEVGPIIKKALKETKLELESLEAKLQVVLWPTRQLHQQPIAGVDIKDIEETTPADSWETLASHIPARTVYEISFLSRSESYVFGGLSTAFGVASSSSSGLVAFSDLPVLRKSLAMTEPLFLSFFIRYWCGPFPGSSRAAAITCVGSYFDKVDVTTDVQILIPYVLYALADPISNVRWAASELVMKLTSIYQRTDGKAQEPKESRILGKDTIYGQMYETSSILWLSGDELSSFLYEILVPSLEECRLDEFYTSRLLANALNGERHNKNLKMPSKELKRSTRTALLTSLSSHILSTPLYAAKSRLLSILDGVGKKIGSISRSKCLLPLLEGLEKQDEKNLKEHCDKELVDQEQFMNCVVRAVASDDREGIRVLQRIIGSDSSPPRSLHKAAFQRVREIWSTLKQDMRIPLSQTLLELVISAPAQDSNHDAYSEAMDTLHAIPLTADVLQSFLENVPLLSPAFRDRSTSSKRRRTSHGHVGGQPDTLNTIAEPTLRHVTVVLELIESSKTGTDSCLTKGLFQVLTDLQHSKSQHGTELAYLQSLVLDCLRRIVDYSKSSLRSSVDHSAIRADLIVDSFRTANSPQVQQAALLLVSSLATIFPELIVHSIMPIFTFMGAGVLRQSDDYSAHVVDKTIDSVIPPLVESLYKQEGGPVVGASELLLSFTAAFEHIPLHRRKTLFSSLVEKLGAEDFLFALLVLLLDHYAQNAEVMSFVTDFTAQFGALIQLKTMEKYFEVALDCLKPKPTLSGRLLSFDDGRTRATTVLNLLLLPALVFRGQRLQSKTEKILLAGHSDAEQLRILYARLVEQTLQLFDQVQPYKKLSKACDDMLDALLGLLSLEESMSSLEGLLMQGNDDVKRQVLRSVEQRISIDPTGSLTSQQSCTRFLSVIADILEKSSDVLLKIAAISCIDRIIEKYGKRDIDHLASVVKIIACERSLGADDPRLRVMALLCLTTSVEVLGEAVIPIVPLAVPKATDYLKETLRKDDADETLHNAVYSFVGSLVLYVPWIVTGQYLDNILKVSHESANSDLSTKGNESRKNVLDLIAKQVDPQECFSALLRTWDSAMVEGPEAVSEHLNILRITIERQPKSVIAKQWQTLLSIFLKAFDLRRIQCPPRTDGSYDDGEIDQVEHTVNEVAITMIYKLNDTMFRPMFAKILEWAINSTTKKDRQGKIYRLITWYTFLHNFFDTLQSIVTSYSSFIIDNAVDALNKSSLEQEDSIVLWNRIISALTSSFEHDQDEFWQSPTHFNTISTPLLSQLTHASKIPTLPILIPCITALAVAADSPDHHKALNAAILAHTRSDNAAVRLAAVQCEMSLTEKLGEEWLALLPEMLPFISELQEDDDEKVEREVRRWILKIEGILGESLDTMLL